ncbi:hypothetical protein OSCT_3084 [Oscillochloris trichoides DG-6]|uniref:Uncharacterized protein n=1 Tax=Oscillochloris trichoides DG-6 TaxID=765420 RepID=E1IID3_9CHLR|nr:hypothetical protein OSCT_3084 [Oscillochloris trichoides DG-6]
MRRGLIAVAGTLMSAVLVDLWQVRWSEWLKSEVNQSPWIIFLLTALIFLSVALLVGYGGSLLLPPDPGFKPKVPDWKERLGSPLLGALNAALIASYLMRYANDIWPEEEAQDLISQSLIANVLDQWLPWFILAMVLSTMANVLVRAYIRISKALKQPVVPSFPQTKRPNQPPPAPARKAAPAGATMPPPPPTQPKAPTPADQAELERIMRDLNSISDKK